MEEKTPFTNRGKIPDEKKELAVALLHSGKSYREVAEALEISIGSVHNIAREPMARIGPLVAELKERFAAKHYLLADHILGKIGDSDIERASLREKIQAAAILQDKARALEKETFRADFFEPIRELERLKRLERREERHRSELPGIE